jgi:hypothetical protein
MVIEKPSGGPTPGVSFDLQMCPRVIFHDIEERPPFSGSFIVLDHLDAAPVENLFAIGGHDGEGQLAILPAMRRQQFRHAFHIPGGAGAPEPTKHEGVRPFVQEQMASIVGAGLFIDPDLRANVVAIGKLGKF